MKPMPEEWQRAVAIVAHPDDLEYGLAGAVARWTDQGKEVSYVLASSGEAGIDGMAPAESGPLREQEQRRSAAIVGVDHVEFLGFPDGLIEADLRLREALAGAIRRLRPEVVITMNFNLTWGDEGPANHADHRAVGLAVIDATRDAANRWLFPAAGEPWQGIEAVYVGGVEDATHYVDIGDTIDRGVASLKEHRVYLEGLNQPEFDPDTFLRDFAGVAGMAAGCDLAVLLRKY